MAQKHTAPIYRGKGEIGRQERPVSGGDAATAKPHPEQGQIGGLRESGPSPGWPLDPDGDIVPPRQVGAGDRPDLSGWPG